ncbi:putative reverse transcriptase domain-containing protein [Tanacetum coccineum]
MEQELWTLTLEGDDIEAYNNRFHEVVLMCPEIKGNVTFSKLVTLHVTINMARELVEQLVLGRATIIVESNKKRWEDHQRNTNHNNPNNNNNSNRNNNHHHQQNKGKKLPGSMLWPQLSKGYAGNLPRCNRCNSHHNGQCLPKCRRCQRTGHQKKDYITRVPGAGVAPLQDVTCCECGNQGHYKSHCQELKN